MVSRTHYLPNIGNVVLVNREQLRFRRHGRQFALPAAKALQRALPTPPATFSGSKNRTIKYPILGNDREGDCYLADALHQIQTWTGNVGVPAQFDPDVVLRRYEQLSGGDNGLTDDQIFPAWKSGLLEVNGPHRILDDMTVDPNDDASIRLGMWLFGGASWTCSLLTGWLDATAPGSIWDASMGSPDPSAGHAMHLSGYVSTPGTGLPEGFYEDETWGIDPCIRLTPAGLKAADPEVTLQFSLDMFNVNGIAPHNGMSYAQLAALWVQCGGQALPPSPFGPPPSPPSGIALTLSAPLSAGTYQAS